MTTTLADALRALLDWGREHTAPTDANSPHELLIAAANALANEPEEVTWTTVDQELPDYGVDVLVTDGKTIAHCCRFISKRDGKYWGIVNADPEDDRFEDVTHWHPLPELPT